MEFVSRYEVELSSIMHESACINRPRPQTMTSSTLARRNHNAPTGSACPHAATHAADLYGRGKRHVRTLEKWSVQEFGTESGPVDLRAPSKARGSVFSAQHSPVEHQYCAGAAAPD